MMGKVAQKIDQAKEGRRETKDEGGEVCIHT